MKLLDTRKLSLLCLLITGVLWSNALADPPVIPANAAYITGYWDNFEPQSSDEQRCYTCGDWIVLYTPPIGVQFNPIGTRPDGSLIDCTHAKSPTQSLAMAVPVGYPHDCVAYSYNRPFILLDYQHFYRFEHDIYIPSSPGTSGAQFYLCCGTNGEIGGYRGRAGGNWLVGNTVETPVDTGLAVSVDQWNHICLEIYPDHTYSIWCTPNDGIKRLMYAGMPLNGRVGGTVLDYGEDIRGQFRVSDSNTYYVDNYKAQLIDPAPLGYPVIYPIFQPIVINGVVDVNTEWAGVRKVASKPVGSKGNFNAVSSSAYWLGLADSTKVDAYIGYDKSFFYIAITGNNMTAGLTDIFKNGRCEVVFTYDYNDVTPTINYAFWAYAAGANQTVNADSIGIYRTTGVSWPSTPIAYSPFTAAGGQISYTVSGTTMQTEMKIPFAFMPEFTGIQSGKKLNVQFNYVEQAIGDHRGTTNLIGDFYPGGGYSQRIQSTMTGITFPLDGDFNADCKVDLKDLKALADNWLLDNKITDIKGTDGKTNFLDYSVMSANWMHQCN